MNTLDLVKHKAAKGVKMPWRSDVDRLSSLLVIGTYTYSAYWLYDMGPKFSGASLLVMAIFIVSSVLRLSDRPDYDSVAVFYGHVFLDIILITALSYTLKTYAFIPIVYALTALGCSGHRVGYVLLTAGLSVMNILLTNMWVSGSPNLVVAFSDSVGVIFNLLIIIGYARIINELFIQKAQLQKQKNQLSEKHEELEQAYDALYISMQERESLVIQQERNRMSGELHDHMGHAMASSLIQLQYVQKVITKSPEKAQEKLAQIHSHLNQSYEEIRQFVRESQTAVATPHNLGQLAKRVEDIQQFTQLELTVDLNPEAINIDLRTDQETHLLRIIQETMTNSLKHGKAQHFYVKIEVRSQLSHETLVITLSDDGVGSGNVVPGFGLTSLKNRAAQIGGQIHFASVPKEGFRTTIQVPLTKHKQELAV